MVKRAGIAISIVIVAFFALRNVSFAMGSDNYQIPWDSVNSGGEDTGSSTNYQLHDTIGEQATGFSTSTDYTLSAGYRVGDYLRNSIGFNVGTQENSTQIAYSSFSTSTKSVIVTDASGFAVDDLIGVVENQGLTENVAVGKIKHIVGNTLYVDAWDGNPSVINPTPSGGNDFVYRLNGSSAVLGTLTSAAGNTSLTVARVTSDAQNGYTVSVSDDGDLRNAHGDAIQNVSDGEVTVGHQEYGWSALGSYAMNTGTDNPFSTMTPTAIQHSDTFTIQEERTALVYKAAINSGTPAGNYSHIVYYTLTANY